MQTDYLSVTEFCKKYNLDGAVVRKSIYAERIPAVKIGNQWAIPADTPKPADLRVKSGKYKNWRKKSAE